MKGPSVEDYREGITNGSGLTMATIRHMAENECREERKRELIEIEKQKIRDRKPFWSFLPFAITINWKK